MPSRMVDARVHAESSAVAIRRLEQDLETLFLVQADTSAQTAVTGLADKAIARWETTVASALMPVRTVTLDALIPAVEAADTGLPDLWVVLLLFPAVAVAAPILVRAAVMVFANEIFRRPILARHRLVSVLLWLATEVLPVVRIDAELFVMLKGKRTPGGLEVEHVKVSILRHQM